MQIQQLHLNNNIILAPMAGITNLPFRLLAKEFGCGLVFSEMISSYGLVHKAPKTLSMLTSDPREKPLGIQIFGSDPEIMATAAAIVEQAGADLLDLNFGCSVKKIVKSGAGVVLMKTPAQTARLLEKVRQAIRIPFTIKIRSGWDPSGDQAVQLARMAASCGVDALTIHPRTAIQGFSGLADWKIISAVKAAVSIPIIGNGDITTPEAAQDMITKTGCDAVMIGRACLGNPFIFSQINDLLMGRTPSKPNQQQYLEVMINYMDATINYLGEEHACYMLRSRLGWFSRGQPYSSKFRAAITQITSRKMALQLIKDYFVSS